MLYLVSAAACCNGVAMGVCFAMYNMHTYIHTYMHSLTHTTHTHTHTQKPHTHTHIHTKTHTHTHKHTHTHTHTHTLPSAPNLEQDKERGRHMGGLRANVKTLHGCKASLRQVKPPAV